MVYPIFRCAHIFGDELPPSLKKMTSTYSQSSADAIGWQRLGRKAFFKDPPLISPLLLITCPIVYLCISIPICLFYIWYHLMFKLVKSWNSWFSICLIRWFNPFSMDFPDLTEVFGLPPLVHTDDPTRAVLACFDMLKAAGHQTTATWRGRLDIFS